MILFIQNNSDKRIWVMTGITPDITNHLYITFNDFEFPEDCPDGEYTYALIAGEDCEYQAKAEMLDTIVNGSFKLRDLHPAVGLLRIGILQEKNIYKETGNKEYIYYKK